MRYAGLRAFIAIAAGIALQSAAHLSVWFLAAYALLALGAAFMTRGYSLLLALAALSALYLEAGTGDMTRTASVRDRVPYLQPAVPFFRRARFEAIVLDEPLPVSGNRIYAVELNRVRIGQRSYPLGLRARMTTGRYLRYGSRIELSGALARFNYPRNPGLVDLNQYYERQGFAGRIRPQSIAIQAVDGGNPLLRTAIMPLRRHFALVIGRYSAGRNRALLAGLLLGEKGDLPEETRNAFSRTGTMHILAVSGLNVAILIGILALVLSVLRIRGWPRLLITVVVAALYVGATGFSASAVRAYLMALSAILGLFIERRYDPLNGICIAGIVILAADPTALLDVGFQLSFAATAAIVLFYRPVMGLFQSLSLPRLVRNWIIAPLAVVVSAQLGTIPLTAYYFYQLSLVSFLANLIVVPLVGLATPLGLLLVAAAPLYSGLGSVLAATLNLILSGIMFLTEGMSVFPSAVAIVGRPPLPVIIWLYGLILLLPGLGKAWVRKVFVFTSLAGLSVILWSSALQPSRLRVTFLDLPKGEATCLELPNGRNLLIDAGGGKSPLVRTFLNSRGINALDLLVLSHPHPHVTAGVEDLSRDLRIRHLLVPVDSTTDSNYTALMTRLRALGTEVAVAGQGDRIQGLGVQAEVFSPTRLLRTCYLSNQLGANDLSLVLRVEYQGCSFLFSGDLDQADLLEPPLPPSELLKSPHQGSVRANSPFLLDLARPSCLVLAARPRPKPKLVERLGERGIALVNLRAEGAAEATVQRHRAVLRRR
jgi:competence protein ComEC